MKPVGIALRARGGEALGLILLLTVAWLLRGTYLQQNYEHPDEIIVTKVVRALATQPGFDSNWAKADLDPILRYDQYNFSSYHYAAYLFTQLVEVVAPRSTWLTLYEGLYLHRLFSALLATVAVIQAYWLARTLAGPLAGFSAGAATAVLPLLVQDAHYARPEAFVTVLTLGVVTLARPLGTWRPARIAGAAVGVGLLIACKVSMLALVWLPLISLWPTQAFHPTKRQVGVAIGLTALGVLFGFALGAPYAVAHLGAFWHGVAFLLKQYAGVHPPHGLIDGGPVALRLLEYVIATAGWIGIALALVGVLGLICERRWGVLVAVAGPVVGFGGYFATRTVFFERNLSHVVPLGAVLAGIGVAVLLRRWPGGRPAWAYGAVGLLVVVAWLRPLDVASRLVFEGFSQVNARRVEAVEQRVRAQVSGQTVGMVATMDDGLRQRLLAHFATSSAPVTLRLIDYHDDWTARHLAPTLAPFVVEELAVQPSLFADIPGCTLHTYNSWTDRYYRFTGLKPR